ncbi:hypothetical protein [Motilimonas sp. 1_MG-2023]|uniref:hypothetical protein n=1 Tax=Motilimonas TaxID=1914248 RepID=UPI0026E43377|nr:hypothetical protein [Motilimonas sp. 1_MG-2023]MDO6527085.1 hypothetical protein [Motilimonas sp. 1_MG-2023]
MLKVFGWLLITVLSTLVISGCSSSQRINNIEQDISQQNLTLSQVETAIVRAGEYKKWTMKVVEPGLIQGDITVRSHQASIDVRYSATRYSISLRNSVNLQQSGDQIHRNYNKWVTLLDREINKNLSVSQ